MANKSKREIRRIKREAIAKITGADANFIGKGRITTQHRGEVEKMSSSSHVCNQKGAFGKRSGEKGVYQTFDKSNKERHKEYKDDRNTYFARKKLQRDLDKIKEENNVGQS